MRSLARGLEVLRSFSGAAPELTISQVAVATGLNRATARRILHTLELLGYVRSSGNLFRLTPKVLAIGYAYLSSMQLAEIAQPHMEKLVAEVRESSSMAILDGTEIVYVARVPTSRIMSISLTVGARLPAYATSMGRVLLAELPDDDLTALLGEIELAPLTERTVHTRDGLRALLDGVRVQGYALNDQELEEGLRSIAVPVRDGRGAALAAINVAVPAARISVDTLLGGILPRLLAAAAEVGEDLTRHRDAGGRLSGIARLD